ncbi:MAG: hypothetical protein ACI8XO_001565 [Verrucomicrobiales bacterium]
MHPNSDNLGTFYRAPPKTSCGLELDKIPAVFVAKAPLSPDSLAFIASPAGIFSAPHFHSRFPEVPYKNLPSSDAGVRYWAIVGIFNMPLDIELDLAAVKKALEDDSHHVRIMAAWVLYSHGMQKEAQDVWNGLLKENS